MRSTTFATVQQSFEKSAWIQEPCLRDHLSITTTFSCTVGWSLKAGFTVQDGIDRGLFRSARAAVGLSIAKKKKGFCKRWEVGVCQVLEGDALTSLLKVTFLAQSKRFQFSFFSCSLSPFRERRRLRSPLRTRKGLAGTCNVRKGPNSAGSIGAQECVLFCALHSLTNR